MKWMFTCLLAMALTLGNSQSFSYDQAETEKVFDLDLTPGSVQDEEAHIVIRNNTGRAINLTWDKVEVFMPPNWFSAVCDNIQCFPPAKESSDFQMAPNSEFEMIVHIYPEGNPGDSAIVDVPVYVTSDGSQEITARFKFYNSQIVSTTILSESTPLKLYPNPTSSYLSVLAEDVVVDRVEVYTLAGQLVEMFSEKDHDMYVGHLPKGGYIVKVITLDNGVKFSRLTLI